jgi:hypothetical protein
MEGSVKEYLLLRSVFSLKKIREFTVPTQVNSASLHPDKTIFVCGGEDLKMYKFDYTTGTEIGKMQYRTKIYTLERLNESSLCIIKCHKLYTKSLYKSFKSGKMFLVELRF